MRHWADGGPTDVDNAALLCQRHHTAVHRRRLVAQVRAAPDEHGRCVVWDLTDGGYDRYLERLRAETSAHDPPPLTPHRFRELLTALTLGAADQRRLADHELHLHDDHPWPEDPRADDPRRDDPWVDGRESPAPDAAVA